ncbi:uncharacterized protein LOC122498318 [Leptopilina heterotoma]|uniref:uncharacterized protein LOC122498318 n=1 Tax=Leptopilina heterotoma TaxID=63436 RepID=UPI001CA81085|nr:uncharacterized protein LOC122498318 [Leptopilina heterotoma]
MMDNEENERKFLIDCFTNDGWFYIVKESALLITEKSEIKVGAKVQFAYPEDVKQPKIRRGKIIMESESDEILDKEMERMIKKYEKYNITKAEVVDKENLEYEEKRLRFKERAREGNVFMAVHLQNELNIKNKEKENLMIKISNALTLTEEANEALLNITKDLQENWKPQ